MNVRIHNDSDNDALCRINDGETFLVAAGQSHLTTMQNSGHNKISTAHDFKSYSMRRSWWRGYIYYLVIDSEYVLGSLAEDVVLTIQHQTEQIDLDVALERFFICADNAVLEQEHHVVAGEMDMKSAYQKAVKRSRVLWVLLTPLWLASGSGLVFGTILSFTFGWPAFLVAFAIGYLFRLVLEIIGEVVDHKLSARFSLDRFPTYFTNDFIVNFYANPQCKQKFSFFKFI